MKSFTFTLGIGLLLASGGTRIIAQEQTDKGAQDQKQTAQTAQPGQKSRESATVKATVEDINSATREITLKKEDGTTVTFKAPESVRNFDQIKKGDVIAAKYSQSLAVSVRKADEPPSATGRTATERSAPGQTPGVKKTNTVQITAAIEKIDRDTRELTLKGPEGKIKTVKVPEEVKKFDELKEGDQVVLTATESLALELTKSQE